MTPTAPFSRPSLILVVVPHRLFTILNTIIQYDSYTKISTFFHKFMAAKQVLFVYTFVEEVLCFGERGEDIADHSGGCGRLEVRERGRLGVWEGRMVVCLLEERRV